MKERWLHTLWGRQDWNQWPLRSCQGQTIQVLDPGRWNNDQGPDFLQAKIFIDQILWVGSVEIHVHSTDWFRHHHGNDPNYLPVILHVVWMKGAVHPDLPTLELSRFLTIPVLKQTIPLLNDIRLLACHRVMRPVPTENWLDWRNQLLLARLQRKRSATSPPDKQNLRRRLARQMGAWVNRDVFESIDASIPNELLMILINDLQTLTALYLGQAGLLIGEDPPSRHLFHLKNSYANIQKKYSLNPPYRQLLWMRIRPTANPFIRLIQLAVLIHQGWQDPARWVVHDFTQIRVSLSQLVFPSFTQWAGNRLLSDSLIESILVNIWSYQQAGDVKSLNSSLQSFGFEQNRFTRLFQSLKLKEATASDSQALLELHESYCEKGRCRECRLAVCWSQPQAPQSI